MVLFSAIHCPRCIASLSPITMVVMLGLLWSSCCPFNFLTVLDFIYFLFFADVLASGTVTFVVSNAIFLLIVVFDWMLCIIDYQTSVLYW